MHPVYDSVKETCCGKCKQNVRIISIFISINRISFYDLNQTNYYTPISRIENLVGVPLCLEYYAWPKNKEAKIESLLVGDDLGICHLYNFTASDWHYCEYKLGSTQAVYSLALNLCYRIHATSMKLKIGFPKRSKINIKLNILTKRIKLSQNQSNCLGSLLQ